MVYLGSKQRLWKELSPIILRDISQCEVYYEPFGGGMNCVTNVPESVLRIAADSDPFIIGLWKGLQRGWLPPEQLCTKEEYVYARKLDKLIHTNKASIVHLGERDVFIIACWKYLASFSARPFEGWVGTNLKRDYYREKRDNLLNHVKDAVNLNSIQFEVSDYKQSFENLLATNVDPSKIIIYADPPYQYTTTYKNVSKVFIHSDFWNWCRFVRSIGIKLYVSEYTAPKDFTCIWDKYHVIGMTLNDEKHLAVERLFI
jgi:DNA adenine methylase